MEWKEIFNTNLRHWGHIMYAYDAAKRSGYGYFVWNGWVYEAKPDGYEKTNVKEKDVH